MKIRAVLIIIVPLVILALALAGGFILLWHLFFLSIVVLLFSYLWALFSMRGIEAQARKSSQRYQVGEWFDEEIAVFNRSKVAKFLVKVEENTDLPGHHNVMAFNLPSQSTHRWRNKVYCQRRGQYSLGSLTVVTTDPFGFFSLHRNLGEPQNILVYPATLELPLFQPLSRNESTHGPNRWLLSEISPNAARVREYANGDTLNRIHWGSTAHTGKLMVKVFDPDRSRYAAKNIWLILDMNQASQLGDGDEATEEYCITIAASLIKKYIDSGKQVGLIASGDRPYLFPPEIGDQHLSHMLEALALMKATGEVSVDQLISREMEHFEASSVIIVITPSTSEGITASLRLLKKRGTMVIAILLDSTSFGGAVSTANATRSLISNGIQVYVIRHGVELARALDSRALPSHMRYVGDVV